MCGITAIVGDVREPAALIEEMNSAVAHRGPDGSGTYVARGVALGHRRLAVIDLSDLAAQPMQNDDGSIALVYNGEIYNFAELRAELEAKGHRFRSHGDTEVVLRLYEEMGDAFVSRLNGMFAFVIWDGRKRRALVARDRFGQKPVFYAEQDGVLYVASEIKALLAVPGISRERSLEAIDAYLTCNWIPAPLTIYRAIHRLEAGEVLVKERDKPSSRSRYAPARPDPWSHSYGEARERADELLTAAVARQLVADVPVGLFLSGGIDSSLVLTRAAARLPDRFDAFTATFDDAQRSELVHAEQAASHRRANLHRVPIGAQDFARPDELVSMFDEPFADVATFAVGKLSRATRNAVTVALTGDGGDELFGGYEVHIAAAIADQLGRPGFVRRGLGRLAPHVPDSAGYRTLPRLLKRGLSLAAEDWKGVARQLRENLDPGERQKLLTADTLRCLGSEEPYRYLLPRHGNDLGALFDPLEDRMLGDLFCHKTDIASMAWGLECRSPFLDVPLAQFARSLPLHFLTRGTTGKRLLRDLVGRELDQGLGRRRKTGFSPPLDQWLRGELTHLLDDYLGDRRAALFDIVSADEVARRVAQHRAGTHNHRRVLWSLVLLQAWLQGPGALPAHPLRAA